METVNTVMAFIERVLSVAWLHFSTMVADLWSAFSALSSPCQQLVIFGGITAVVAVALSSATKHSPNPYPDSGFGPIESVVPGPDED